MPKFITNIVNFYVELPGKIARFLANVVTGLATWASNMIAKAKETIPGIITSIVSFFEELPGKMLTIGGNLVEGLWNGINGMVSWLKEKIKDFASGIIAGIKDALGIASPSKVMIEIGKNMSQGMAVGIASGAGNVQSALDGLVSGVEALGGGTIGVNANFAGGGTAGGAWTTNQYTFAPGSIVIPAKDLSEMRTIQDFFNRLPQVARQGG